MQLKSSNSNKNIELEYITRLYNDLTQLRDFVNKTNKIIVDHVQTESLRRLEDLVVLRMLSRNILSFRIEKLIYFNENHVVSYMRTRDNQFFRLEITKDDFLNFHEKEFLNEKEFYCGLRNDLLSLANSVPKDLNKQILEEAEKAGQICK